MTHAHSDDEKPKVPADSAKKETDLPGAGQDLLEYVRGRCQDYAAQRPHDVAQEENRERTVRREHLVCQPQVQGSTRHADRSIKTSVSVPRSAH